MRVLAGTMRGGVFVASVLLALGLLIDERLIQAGLVILVLTPLVRVVVLTRVFARKKDWPFAAISIGVILLLLVSAILA